MLYQNRNHKWVYAFSEGGVQYKKLLGGKGANVSEMFRAGLPVPPGFTISTEACNGYSQYQQQFPEGMWTQAQQVLRQVELDTDKKFGDTKRPLLVSVRSGAEISMPGMMDTVLNLGLNDETVEGLAAQTKNRTFALDAYRRFISMFAHIVMDIAEEKFSRIFESIKGQNKSSMDSELSESQLEELIATYKRIILAERHGDKFPQDPYEQLRMAIAAVFDSWNRHRAVEYRRIHYISDELGTAVNVQAMVFGNMGLDSGTGVCFTRHPSTGEKKVFGEYLLNAQGEDVVAGIRTPRMIAELDKDLPSVYGELMGIIARLEKHYQDMQDIEFTIEQNKLWILQTRSGKRTGLAAVRIAVDMVKEGVFERKMALLRVEPKQLEQLLHPAVEIQSDTIQLTTGLPASPGAASGIVVFDPDEAVIQAGKDLPVILVRTETSPDDFHGMIAAQAVLTIRGGMTSHAAVVARGMGKPCVVGAGDMHINQDEGIAQIGEIEVRKGEWITIDGASGAVFLGKVPTKQPDLGSHYHELMGWADECRRLLIRANADTKEDALRAREFGAEGIGLCRTEHMFFQSERMDAMREMILADTLASRQQALDKLLPMQRQDFLEIFKAMDGLPITIRLLDPPLHEFLPNYEDLQAEIYELKFQLQRSDSFTKVDGLLALLWEKEQLLQRIGNLRETNPMLGHRGCRLGLIYPEITAMQTQAIFEAACRVKQEGIDVRPEIMIPLVSMEGELSNQRAIVEQVAQKVLGEHGMEFGYLIGTMLELPRACLRAGKIAQQADFFSFGTNDLTQTTFGLSRDDSARFLSTYISEKLIANDPFQALDQEGVGELIRIGLERGRSTKPELKVGICGEHGGEPSSIAFCHSIGLDYVSCSPYRLPIARLAAAHAQIKEETKEKTKDTTK